MHSADYAVARCLSIFPFVCPSHAGIMSQRLNISPFFSPSGSYIVLVFFTSNAIAIFRLGTPPPLTAASNARGMKRSQNATYFAFWGNQWEATAQYYTLLERSFHGQHFTADTMRPSWTVTQHVKLQSWRCWKIVKIQHIWPYRKRPGELTPCHTFLKAPVKTMLSPNWHVTLRLIVFRTFAVKWLFRGPNTDRLSILVSHLEIPIGTMREKTHLGHTSTITLNLTPIVCTPAEISVPRQSKKVRNKCVSKTRIRQAQGGNYTQSQ